ncbi:MAG: peptide chain release factor 1 [Planctomycetota bacterium]|nr:peptide chain release factor 1 [Planctomycetota bacterium]MDG2085633.1 peptide chain release factor 1 [Planctomycetota bacterium]
MLDKLSAMQDRFVELEQLISDPENQGSGKFQDMLKEHGSLAAMVTLYRDYSRSSGSLQEAEEIIASGDDEELKELAEAELEDLQKECCEKARTVRMAILDQQVEGGDDCIFEVRAGAGGEEAALFCSDMFRLYSLYAEKRRWKIEVLSESVTDLGGFKEITFAVRGSGAFTRLCFESGGHRVQRVPATETQGRIHTSAITVAVMQEAEESEIEIEDKDLRIDTFCASGPGGQSVNKTSSAVRITHMPTGVVVSMQDEKSQHRNRDKAMRLLKTRMKELADREKREEEDALRRSLIGSGDRSDRIRTYNFPQNRISDHRINCTLYNLDRFMTGDVDDLLDQLEAHDREERVQSL